MRRPWQGAEETPSGEKLAEYDPQCYLCPGNARANGTHNAQYTTTFLFENDFAALKPAAQEPLPNEDGIRGRLFRIQPARGRCYVLCFNRRHDLTLAQLTTAPFNAQKNIVPIIETWQHLYRSIPEENPFIKYIQFFENKGAAMGCSNPHPHGQVWSLDYVPTEPATELKSMRSFALDPENAIAQGPRDAHGRPSLLLEYATLELRTVDQPRVVTLNDTFVALVPFWAVWPFEVLVVPHQRAIPSIADLSETETLALASIMGEVACRFDNVFSTSFPYSMGVHQRPVPCQGDDDGEFAILHVHYFPPLLRSATVRKFSVGYVCN
ncbi:UDP-glucose--hexose-1-phosphate uridylyltransferase [Malassezia vespertilionis]|uniref:UDP-glucose--hexose-1-phosphate uridylyltransferase n=1 Tax=Malassezia vespertilionis TaxID=2020962 RepID=UPI0024B23472|nr:UDP-glucose--hexose-1-phosphate uridylyltransferase [Malassezia vespertilionis]WFD06830.1 UDP-glucose--hexose-1-phosphate uridylyltransferase [Malassezia vespertilionis]